MGPSSISQFFPLYCEGMNYCSSEVLACQQPDLDLRTGGHQNASHAAQKRGGGEAEKVRCLKWMSLCYTWLRRVYQRDLQRTGLWLALSWAVQRKKRRYGVCLLFPRADWCKMCKQKPFWRFRIDYTLFISFHTYDKFISDFSIPAFFREFLWQDRQKEKSESRREERREEVQLMLSSHHCHHPKAETSPMSFQAPPEAEVSAAPAPAPAVVPAPAMAPTRPATVPGCVDLGGACWRQYQYCRQKVSCDDDYIQHARVNFEILIQMCQIVRFHCLATKADARRDLGCFIQYIEVKNMMSCQLKLPPFVNESPCCRRFSTGLTATTPNTLPSKIEKHVRHEVTGPQVLNISGPHVVS